MASETNLRPTSNLLNLTPDHERTAQHLRRRDILHILQFVPVDFGGVDANRGARGDLGCDVVVPVVDDYPLDKEEEEEADAGELESF